MTSKRDKVIAAFETGDQLAVKRLGWWDVWEASATWWAPRQVCTAKEMVPYAKLLGSEEPAAVLAALRDLARHWAQEAERERAAVVVEGDAEDA